MVNIIEEPSADTVFMIVPEGTNKDDEHVGLGLPYSSLKETFLKIPREWEIEINLHKIKFLDEGGELIQLLLSVDECKKKYPNVFILPIYEGIKPKYSYFIKGFFRKK